MSSKRSKDQPNSLSGLQEVRSVGGKEDRKVAAQVAVVLVAGSWNWTGWGGVWLVSRW